MGVLLRCVYGLTGRHEKLASLRLQPFLITKGDKTVLRARRSLSRIVTNSDASCAPDSALWCSHIHTHLQSRASPDCILCANRVARHPKTTGQLNATHPRDAGGLRPNINGHCFVGEIRLLEINHISVFVSETAAPPTEGWTFLSRMLCAPNANLPVPVLIHENAYVCDF